MNRGNANSSGQGAKRRYLLVAIGEAGHAFPLIAIGRELVARGHEVGLHTWFRWQEHIEAAGMRFFKAPVFEHPPDQPAPNVHEAAALAARQLSGVIQDFRPDVVVSDVLTLSGTLASELNNVPLVSFVPHFWHATGDDTVPFGSGWAPAHNPIARAFFKRLGRLERRALEFGRDEMNETRRHVGLPAIDRVHGGLSQDLVLVGTLPQLEPPRDWPPHVKVIGPVMWEPPSRPTELPPGDDPLVVIAPSTAQDLQHRMLGASVSGLRDLPVRVLATKNAREPEHPLKPGANTVIVGWVSYSQVMPIADVIVCHGGHGTIMRALTSGTVPVVIPASGDQFENGARLRWAGVGVSVPSRFLSRRTIAAAVEKVLRHPEMTERARQLAAWAADNNGAERAADEIEAFSA
ncbi:MAG: glycosyltransferase [Actinobacteria bacterium]|nr:glycosyltransferase [Actinomycetota bacterium]